MRALLRISEGAFWLLALVSLAPAAACQWAVGRAVGAPAVFGQLLADLWHARRRRGRPLSPAAPARSRRGSR